MCVDFQPRHHSCAMALDYTLTMWYNSVKKSGNAEKTFTQNIYMEDKPMKKTAAAILSLLLLCTGCGAKEGDNTAETTASTAETTISEETAASVTETVTESVTETVTEAKTEAAPSGLSAEEAYAAKNGASWTSEVFTEMFGWEKGNTILTIGMEEEGMVVSMLFNTYGDNMYMNIDIPSMMTMTSVTKDGKSYLLDHPSKTYSTDDSDMSGSYSMDDYANSEADYSKFSSDGIEEIDGVQYIYEEFSSTNPDSGETSTVRYYFTSDKKITKAGTDGIYMDFGIELLETPDEAIFEIPEGYTEISSDEMGMKMLAGLFGALEDLEDTEGAEEADSAQE